MCWVAGNNCICVALKPLLGRGSFKFWFIRVITMVWLLNGVCNRINVVLHVARLRYTSINRILDSEQKIKFSAKIFIKNG
jgi:hypothetical protein